jgi:hypothetical protein
VLLKRDQSRPFGLHVPGVAQYLLAPADQIEQANEVFAGVGVAVHHACLALLKAEPESGKLTHGFQVQNIASRANGSSLFLLLQNLSQN